MSTHLDTITQVFVKKEKRERILSLASSLKRRADMVDALLHDTRALAPEVLRRVADDADAEQVIAALRKEGAGARAYVIGGDMDDREAALADAIRAAPGKERDVLVFALGSRAASYENHEGERFLLVR
jgi:hypothetical protein